METNYFYMAQTDSGNIRRGLHIIDQINQEETSVILMSVDAEKAFDSVMTQVIRKFCFCKKFQ